jgi:hypothetical protein
MPITDETRKTIYHELVKELMECSPPMVAHATPEKLGIELIGNKPVPYGYDKKIIPGMYFASVMQRKDSVAFYFFPSYMHAGLKEIAPSLYKCLKGKTCFHFKKPEEVNQKELKALLKEGLKQWKKYGYIND